jgi:transcription termination factor Rho
VGPGVKFFLRAILVMRSSEILMSESERTKVMEESVVEVAEETKRSGPGIANEAAPPNIGEPRRRSVRNNVGGSKSGGGYEPRSSRRGRSSGQGYQKRQKKRPSQGSAPKRGKKKAKSRNCAMLQVSDDSPSLNIGSLTSYELFENPDEMEALAQESSSGGEPLQLNRLYEMPLLQLVDEARSFGVEVNVAENRIHLIDRVVEIGFERRIPISVSGIMEMSDDGYGMLVYENDNYRVRPQNAFVAKSFIKKHGLKRGHMVEAQLLPHREGESCPFIIRLNSVMDAKVEENLKVEPFEDLVPYYPLQRILLETDPDVPWDNLSMRVIDLLTPIGFGQRGLIVSPPRTGKTVLLQCIANSVAQNYTDAHLIVLLVDERPEEVTDFERQVKGEVISSTFDQPAESHVHAAEMVIEKARRMVEAGRDVVILLDSITRLARAYNTLMPSSGKILSGGVEASALQKPKRFFGSARNIEGGGSLTIIGTALIETGSRMDEVIFEEFKGTGNMELNLDRALVDKRIFPAINLEKSGTRKEELLYHPDEMNKIYSLRRAMKGVPSNEAMEMLIQRVKKTSTNAEFLMGLNR